MIHDTNSRISWPPFPIDKSFAGVEQTRRRIPNAYTLNDNPDALMDAREKHGNQLHQHAHPLGTGPKRWPFGDQCGRLKTVQKLMGRKAIAMTAQLPTSPQLTS